jgi:putative SOS response-associated peptidase YedK
MPVILDGPEAEAAWLDPDVDLDGAPELVRPLWAGITLRGSNT